ncbi:MAG: clostripain-related cysteine peptidase [Candidatus Helarchaeota archaeon]
MKKIGILLVQLFLIALLLFNTFGSLFILPITTNLGNSQIQTKILPEWCYMVYLDADNNLDSYGVDDLNEIEYGYDDAVASHVKVIVFIDRYSSGGTTYLIEHDTDMNVIDSSILSTGFPSEPDMGAKNTLKNFIKFVFNNYPAQHYVLDCWDHGGGIFGICWDDTDSNNALSFDEVDEAISEAVTETGEDKIDILAMDACLMQMLETDYELNDKVDYIVASEETIPGYGFCYDTMIATLCSNYASYAVNPDQYAEQMVQDYHDSYSSSYDTTLSAVSVASSSFTNLMQSFNEFINATLNVASRDVLAAARAASQTFYYESFVDLKDFCDQLASRTTGSVQLAATNLANNVSNVVLRSREHNNPRAYGISIYFPDNDGDYDTGYDSIIDLGQETGWSDFLDYFYHGPTYKLTYISESFDDTSGGDGDAVVEQSETIDLMITIKNTGNRNAYFVNGTLTCDNGNITITDGFKDYTTGTTPMVPNEQVSRTFRFNISSGAPTGLIIEFTITINATFIDPTAINYGWERKVYTIINISVVKGGTSFDSAVDIDQILNDNNGTFYSWLPGPDPTDFGAWFKLYLEKGVNDTVNYLICGIIEGPDATDFDVYFYTPSGSLLTAAAASWYPDVFSSLLPNTGYYRLRVVPYNGTGVYRMNVTPSDVPGPEDGLSWGTAYTLMGNETAPATANGTAPAPTKSGYVFYRVYLAKGWGIKAILDSTGTDFDVYIVNREFQAISAGQSSGYPDSCQTHATYTGYYYILIVPKTGSGAFTLTVEWKEPFHLSTWMIIIIVVIVGLAVIVGIWLFFKMMQ